MKAALCAIGLPLVLAALAAPTMAYTYSRYPTNAYTDTQQQEQLQQQPLYLPTSAFVEEDAAEDLVEEVLEQQQQTVDQYLGGLLEALETYGAPENVQEAAEEQVEQAQETYDQAGEYVQGVFDTLVEAIYGPKSNTTTADDDLNENENDATTAAVLRVSTQGYDDDEDDDDATTVAPATTASTTTTTTTTTTTAPTESVDDRYIKGGITAAATDDDDAEEEEDDDNDVPTMMAFSEEDEDDDEDDDDDFEDDAGIVTTAATVERTLSTVDVYDDDNSDEDDNDPTTTTTAAPTTTTTTPTTTTTTPTTTTTTPTTTTTTPTTTTTTTTTTTAAPTTTTSAPVFPTNLCDGCEFKHGVGYNPHPTDCTLFVQCRLGNQGYPVVAGVQACPHGLYWNQHKLTCDHRRNVNCVDDICRGYKKTKRSGASCRGYWDCSSGTAAAKCCARGFAYNPVTDRCHYQPGCQDDCLTTPTVDLECNGMRAVAGDRTVYEVKTGNTWTRMPCPPTLAFSTNPCGCTEPLNQSQHPSEPVCAPELYLPFHTDAGDYSGLNVWVKNEGVLVKDGKAYFDGDSRLIVNRFSNAWWGATVYVHLRYKSLSAGSGPRQALVTNGDCQTRPSLAVCVGPRGVDFYAETTKSALPANITVPYGLSEGEGWHDVLYKLDNNQLHGYLNTYAAQAPAEGVLETRQRGLVIGSGGGCEDFEGFIDELTVYLCRPYYK